ncbi:MAG: hypothetical protein RLZZ184_2965 [Cyanobacteriota bacterium]
MVNRLDDDREFKDSALGMIPKDWEVIRLEEILLEFINGYAFKSEEYQEFGYPIIRMTNISIEGNFQIIQESIKYCSFDDYKKLSKYHVFQGDLIIAMTDVTPNKGIIGRSVIVNIDEKFLLNQRVGLLRINLDKIDIRFLQKFTNSYHFREYSKSTSGASAQANLSTCDIKKAFIFLPPLPEQQQIAKILDTVDKAIAQTEILIAKYKRVKSGLMQDLLTRGIDENGQLRDRTTHKFKRSPLGMIPVEWDVCPLGEKITLQRGFDLTTKKRRQGNIPVVSSSGITGYHDTTMLEGPGVITGRKGTLGEVFYIEGPYWPHDTPLWVKDFHGNYPEFVAHLLGFLKLEKHDAATANPTLNRNYIHPIIIAIPKSVDEQKKIVKNINAINRYIQHEKIKINNLQKIKTGLMQDLLTGKISVKPLLTNEP